MPGAFGCLWTAPRETCAVGATMLLAAIAIASAVPAPPTSKGSFIPAALPLRLSKHHQIIVVRPIVDGLLDPKPGRGQLAHENFLRNSMAAAIRGHTGPRTRLAKRFSRSEIDHRQPPAGLQRTHQAGIHFHGRSKVVVYVAQNDGIAAMLGQLGFFLGRRNDNDVIEPPPLLLFFQLFQLLLVQLRQKDFAARTDYTRRREPDLSFACSHIRNRLPSLPVHDAATMVDFIYGDRRAKRRKNAQQKCAAENGFSFVHTAPRQTELSCGTCHETGEMLLAD